MKNIFNKDLRVLAIIMNIGGLIFALSFVLYSMDWDFEIFGLILAYLIGFRTPHAIDFKENKVIVKCLLWHYKYSVNSRCKVTDWGRLIFIVFNKSHFVINSGDFQTANKDFIKSIPYKMIKIAVMKGDDNE